MAVDKTNLNKQPMTSSKSNANIGKALLKKPPIGTTGIVLIVVGIAVVAGIIVFVITQTKPCQPGYVRVNFGKKSQCVKQCKIQGAQHYINENKDVECCPPDKNIYQNLDGTSYCDYCPKDQIYMQRIPGDMTGKSVCVNRCPDGTERCPAFMNFDNLNIDKNELLNNGLNQLNPGPEGSPVVCLPKGQKCFIPDNSNGLPQACDKNACNPYTYKESSGSSSPGDSSNNDSGIFKQCCGQDSEDLNYPYCSSTYLQPLQGIPGMCTNGKTDVYCHDYCYGCQEDQIECGANNECCYSLSPSDSPVCNHNFCCVNNPGGQSTQCCAKDNIRYIYGNVPPPGDNTFEDFECCVNHKWIPAEFNPKKCNKNNIEVNCGTCCAGELDKTNVSVTFDSFAKNYSKLDSFLKNYQLDTTESGNSNTDISVADYNSIMQMLANNENVLYSMDKINFKQFVNNDNVFIPAYYVKFISNGTNYLYRFNKPVICQTECGIINNRPVYCKEGDGEICYRMKTDTGKEEAICIASECKPSTTSKVYKFEGTLRENFIYLTLPPPDQDSTVSDSNPSNVIKVGMEVVISSPDAESPSESPAEQSSASSGVLPKNTYISKITTTTPGVLTIQLNNTSTISSRSGKEYFFNFTDNTIGANIGCFNMENLTAYPQFNNNSGCDDNDPNCQAAYPLAAKISEVDDSSDSENFKIQRQLVIDQNNPWIACGLDSSNLGGSYGREYKFNLSMKDNLLSDLQNYEEKITSIGGTPPINQETMLRDKCFQIAESLFNDKDQSTPFVDFNNTKYCSVIPLYVSNIGNLINVIKVNSEQPPPQSGQTSGPQPTLGQCGVNNNLFEASPSNPIPQPTLLEVLTNSGKYGNFNYTENDVKSNNKQGNVPSPSEKDACFVNQQCSFNIITIDGDIWYPNQPATIKPGIEGGSEDQTYNLQCIIKTPTGYQTYKYKLVNQSNKDVATCRIIVPQNYAKGTNDISELSKDCGSNKLYNYLKDYLTSNDNQINWVRESKNDDATSKFYANGVENSDLSTIKLPAWDPDKTKNYKLNGDKVNYSVIMTGNKTESGNAPGFISVDETPIKYTGTEGETVNFTHTMPVIEERISAESGAKPSYKISQYITDYLYSTQEQTPSVLLSPYTTSKTDSGENLSIYSTQCGEFGSNLGTAHCPAGSFCVPGGVGGSCPDGTNTPNGVVINQVLKNSDGKISAADKMQCTYCCTGQEVEGTGCKQCDTGYFKPDPQTGGAECSICNSNEQHPSLRNPTYVNFQKTTCNSCTLQDNYYYSPNPQGLCTVNSNDGKPWDHGCCNQYPDTYRCTEPETKTCTQVSNGSGYSNKGNCEKDCKPPPQKDEKNAPYIATGNSDADCASSKTGYAGLHHSGVCIPLCSNVSDGESCSESELGYTCATGGAAGDVITCGGIGLDTDNLIEKCPNDRLQKIKLVSQGNGWVAPIPSCVSNTPWNTSCNPYGYKDGNYYGNWWTNRSKCPQK